MDSRAVPPVKWARGPSLILLILSPSHSSLIRSFLSFDLLLIFFLPRGGLACALAPVPRSPDPGRPAPKSRHSAAHLYAQVSRCPLSTRQPPAAGLPVADRSPGDTGSAARPGTRSERPAGPGQRRVWRGGAGGGREGEAGTRLLRLLTWGRALGMGRHLPTGPPPRPGAATPQDHRPGPVQPPGPREPPRRQS